MVRLYIEGSEIELDKTVLFAITKQFEDITNPTTIINDWSKTVSIPFTIRNHSIFGHIYNPDKAIVATSGTTHTGIYFDPLRKLDFRLEWDGAILMIGYAKMNEIKLQNGKGTYEITLFGELGKVFQEMQKITFDTTTEDTNYLIDGSLYVDETIDKDLIYKSWTSSGQIKSEIVEKYYNMIDPTTGEIYKRINPNYKVTDYIGFAPNNAFSDDGFEYTTFLTSNNLSQLFSEYIENIAQFKENVGISLDSVIPNGLLPREWADYRSYMQLPFIYFNKLFQIFQKKAEQITGYTFNLDNNWFNTSNPYWYNLVYMLKNFDIKLGNDYFNQFMTNCIVDGETPNTNELKWFTYRSEYMGGSIDNTSNTYTYLLSNVRNVNGNAGLYDSSNNVMKINDEKYELSFQINPNLQVWYGNANAAEYFQDKTTLYLPLVYDLIITGSNGYVETKRAVIISDDAPQVVQNIKLSADVVIKENGHPINAPTTTSREWDWNIKYPTTEITNNKFGNSISIKIEAYFYKNNLSAFPIAMEEVVALDSLAGVRGYIYDDTTIYNYNNANTVRFHSGNHFVLNDLWNKEFNLFNEIMRYCKIYRICVICDDYNKEIIFKPFYKCFVNYSIVDWTNKVDKSKDFNIKPLTFENKYIIFNYDDNNTKLGKEYKEKYGLNFGSYRLVTDYNFDINSKDLFKGVKQSIVSTDNVLNYYWLVRNRITYSFPSEIFVLNKDKDNKLVSLFGSYFFHNGLANFELNTDLQMKSPFISDDTEWQVFNNTYMYNLGASMSAINVSTYPKLDIVNGNNLCVFNIPKENYTYLNNYTDKKSIYYNFWETYINERYSVQNKLLTCYIDLTPSDYNNFNWNKFVKIGNTLYIVNKIYDYDVTSNLTTKVDLITVYDVNGYTSNAFVGNYNNIISL